MWEYWRGRLSSNERERRTSIGEDALAQTTKESNVSGRSTTVNFKDLNLLLEDESVSDDGAEAVGEEEEVPKPRTRRLKKVVERNKLIIIMVGLPGRGKTFLCNKLVCYLNW